MTKKWTQLDLKQLLRADASEGKLFINSHRMVLIPTSALGMIQRDLVNTMGMERAKGFLLRYGYAWGQNDAVFIRAMSSWETVQEMILAGPMLHAREGVVKVTPEVLEVDFQNKTLYMKGIWENSYESEEHVRRFGFSDSPVCWTLVGYASGYLTELLGYRVIVTETMCMGKGDPHCAFEAQSIDANAQKWVEELRYYEAESLSSELDRAYKRIETLNEKLMRSFDIHKSLTELLLQGKKLEDICLTVSDLLDMSVYVETTGGGIVSGYCRDPAHAGYYRSSRSGALAKQKSPGVVNRLPIVAHREQFGCLVAVGERDLDTLGCMVLERAALVCAITMYYDRIALESERRMKGDFLEELLSRNVDRETILRHAKGMGYDVQEPHRFVVIQAEPFTQLEEIRSFLCDKNTALNAIVREGKLVLLLPETVLRERQTPISDYLIYLCKQIEAKFHRLELYVGAGRAYADMTRLAKSYEEALASCKFVSRARLGETRTMAYEQLGFVSVLLHTDEPAKLADYYRCVMGSLIDYDSKHNSDLILTLDAYLELGCNLRKTAQVLNISNTGLRYRLEKIEEIAKVDLNDGNDRLKMHIGVQIYRLFKDWR